MTRPQCTVPHQSAHVLLLSPSAHAVRSDMDPSRRGPLEPCRRGAARMERVSIGPVAVGEHVPEQEGGALAVQQAGTGSSTVGRRKMTGWVSAMIGNRPQHHHPSHDLVALTRSGLTATPLPGKYSDPLVAQSLMPAVDWREGRWRNLCVREVWGRP